MFIKFLIQISCLLLFIELTDAVDACPLSESNSVWRICPSSADPACSFAESGELAEAHGQSFACERETFSEQRVGWRETCFCIDTTRNENDAADHTIVFLMAVNDNDASNTNVWDFLLKFFPEFFVEYQASLQSGGNINYYFIIFGSSIFAEASYSTITSDQSLSWSYDSPPSAFTSGSNQDNDDDDDGSNSINFCIGYNRAKRLIENDYVDYLTNRHETDGLSHHSNTIIFMGFSNIPDDKYRCELPNYDINWFHFRFIESVDVDHKLYNYYTQSRWISGTQDVYNIALKGCWGGSVLSTLYGWVQTLTMDDDDIDDIQLMWSHIIGDFADFICVANRNRMCVLY